MAAVSLASRVVAGEKAGAGQANAQADQGPDAVAVIQTRAVHKFVKDFPEKTDLSTPESATAALYRTFANPDPKSWLDLSPWAYTERDVVDIKRKIVELDPHPSEDPANALLLKYQRRISNPNEWRIVNCRYWIDPARSYVTLRYEVQVGEAMDAKAGPERSRSRHVRDGGLPSGPQRDLVRRGGPTISSYQDRLAR